MGPLEQRRRPKRAGMRHEQWPHGDDAATENHITRGPEARCVTVSAVFGKK